jgi:hypothetical protein
MNNRSSQNLLGIFPFVETVLDCAIEPHREVLSVFEVCWGDRDGGDRLNVASATNYCRVMVSEPGFALWCPAFHFPNGVLNHLLNFTSDNILNLSVATGLIQAVHQCGQGRKFSIRRPHA